MFLGHRQRLRSIIAAALFGGAGRFELISDLTVYIEALPDTGGYRRFFFDSFSG